MIENLRLQWLDSTDSDREVTVETAAGVAIGSVDTRDDPFDSVLVNEFNAIYSLQEVNDNKAPDNSDENANVNDAYNVDLNNNNLESNDNSCGLCKKTTYILKFQMAYIIFEDSKQKI